MSQEIRWRMLGCDFHGVYSEAQAALDVGATDRLHRELEQSVGQGLDRPNLLERPVVLSIVGEVEGEVKHGVYLEAELEVCAVGPNVLPAQALEEAMRVFLMPVASEYQIRMVRAFVPATMCEDRLTRRKRPIQRLLARCGFTQDSGMTQFFRRLQPARKGA